MGSRRCFRRIGPIISQRQPVSRLWGGVSGDVKMDWGQAVWTRKGGRREAELHTHARLVCGCSEGVLQTRAQAQGRAKEGRTGETLGCQARLGLGARCRIQACLTG